MYKNYFHKIYWQFEKCRLLLIHMTFNIVIYPPYKGIPLVMGVLGHRVYYVFVGTLYINITFPPCDCRGIKVHCSLKSHNA